EIDGTVQLRSLEDVNRCTGYVVNRDPGPELPAVAELGAQTEPVEGEQHTEHAAVRAQHVAEARVHDAYPCRARRSGRFLPLTNDCGKEARSLCAAFIQLLGRRPLAVVVER